MSESTSKSKLVRIGCSAGFWGDSTLAAAQLVKKGNLDYLVSDYLAEVTMSILARIRSKNPKAGYVPDFVTSLTGLWSEITKQGIRVVTNAGGMNPRACRDAIVSAAEAEGVSLNAAVVEGDDLMPRINELAANAPIDMFSGEEFPKHPVSINAYLGALPVARALDDGAQVVITGRSVDSAQTLGPLMHEFGWNEDDYDLLAAGSLAGHVIECGAQATGGLFTDWAEVPGWENMGYPIVECSRDGDFVVTKPEGTGGLVSSGTVSEQILYEIGDPSSYLLPDVTCDFTGVNVKQLAKNRVHVCGVKGRAPSPNYKVSVTHADGYRSMATVMLGGFDADKKARRVAEAILTRTRRIFSDLNYADYTDTCVEVIGSEDTYGKNARLTSAREVILKIGVKHPRKEALEWFSKELTSAGTCMAQGITGLFAGRPKVTPVVRLFSYTIDKNLVPVTVNLDGSDIDIIIKSPPPDIKVKAHKTPPEKTNIPVEVGEEIEVPLLALAHGRSGDKGDHANIGIISRSPKYMGLLRKQLTPEVVGDYFSHILEGSVERFELPGLGAFNFLMHNALGGGGMASLRYDPQGKAFAQMLLDLPITVPATWQKAGGPLAGFINKSTDRER